MQSRLGPNQYLSLRGTPCVRPRGSPGPRGRAPCGWRLPPARPECGHGCRRRARRRRATSPATRVGHLNARALEKLQRRLVDLLHLLCAEHGHPWSESEIWTEHAFRLLCRTGFYQSFAARPERKAALICDRDLQVDDVWSRKSNRNSVIYVYFDCMLMIQRFLRNVKFGSRGHRHLSESDVRIACRKRGSRCIISIIINITPFEPTLNYAAR